MPSRYAAARSAARPARPTGPAASPRLRHDVPMGFTRAELESFRDVEVPDLLPVAGQPLRLLFVGINPGLWTAATQTHFARPGNRFYPALLRAGILDVAIDPSAGMTDADRDALRDRGIGITNVVARATARADELSPEELRDGRAATPGTRGRATTERRRGRRRHRLSHGVRRAPGHGRRAARTLGQLAGVRGAQPVGAQRPRDRRHACPRLRRGGQGGRGARGQAGAVNGPCRASREPAGQAAHGDGSRPCCTSSHSTRSRSRSSSSPGGRTSMRWATSIMSAASPRTRS